MKLRFWILVIGSVAAAQQPMPSQDAAALRRYLRLNDGQLQRMLEARQQAQRQSEEKRRSSEAQIREKHAALQVLLDRNSSDATAVGKAVLELRAAEKQRMELDESIRNAGLNVLTAEQRTRFQAVEDAALLPIAAQEAVRMGLVQGVPRPPQGPANMQGPRNPQAGPGMQPQGGPRMNPRQPQGPQQPMGPPRPVNEPYPPVK